MTLLPHTPNIYESMYQLILYAFNKIDSPDYKETYFTLAAESLNFGILKDGKVQNQLMALPFQSNIFTIPVKTAGISYVASYPEARGNGEIKKLFQELFQKLSDDNYDLAYLAPFSQTFYRNFGFENAFYQKLYTWTSESFAFLNKTPKGIFKRYSINNVETGIIDALYQNSLASKHGNIQRSKHWWQYLTKKHPNYQVAILYKDTDAYGYMIYEMNTSFDIIELCYPDYQTLCQLLEFASRHVGTFTKFTYKAPASEKIEQAFLDTITLKIELKPYMMLRIIDFKHFYSKIAAILQNDDVTIEIIDKQIQKNNHRFTLTTNSCQVTSKEADYSADIATWSAIFTGALSLEEALFKNLVNCYKQKELHIPTKDLTLYDYF